jgi:hypothetical protein
MFFSPRVFFVLISACFVTLIFLFCGLLEGIMSHSSPPTTQQFSSTAAIFAFGRTSVVLQERLGICCFAGKVMDKSYSFGTHEFSPSIFSMTFAVFQAYEVLDWLLGGRTMQ